MPLLIDEKRLIPAPLVTINKTSTLGPDGTPISSQFNITLQGTLLPNKGSPCSLGWHEDDSEPADELFITDEDKFDSLLAKQELLREAFASPGFNFQYYAEGLPRITSYPRLASINFSPRQWVQRTDYTIQLEAGSLNREFTVESEDEFIAGATGLNLQSVSDSWQISQREDGQSTYSVQRTVSATAKAAYASGNVIFPSGNEAWENAKSWVDYRLANVTGFEGNQFSLPLTSGGNYNVVTTESSDRNGGTYSVTQAFIHNSGNTVEERGVDRVITRNTIGNSGSFETEAISVQGTITGLSTTNDPDEKLLAASGQWDILKSTLGAIVGANGSGINENASYDTKNGVVSYSISFINNGVNTFTHTYDVNYQFGADQVSLVSINGIISGVSDDGFDVGRFAAATGAWGTISGQVRALAFAEAAEIFNDLNANDFSVSPTVKNTAYNKANGTITYNFNFPFVLDGSATYIDEYSVELDTENAQAGDAAGLNINARVQGMVRGIATDEDLSTRIANAEAGWSAISGDLLTRANSHISKLGGNTPGLNILPLTKTVTVNRNQGSIGYSIGYNNREAMPTGVAILDINIDETYPNDIFAVQIIPGRQVGPIIQTIGTVSEKNRSINISMTMHPNAGGFWAYSDIATPRNISNNLVTSGISDLGVRGTGYYVSQDSDSWNWKAGLYTRTFTAVYSSGVIFP